MKAYRCWDDCDPSYSTIIFAESAGKARSAALSTDLLEDCEFTEILVRRVPELDSEYRGRTEMEWYDEQDRLALISKGGYQCEDPELWECETCIGKEYCAGYEYALEIAREVEDDE